MTVESTLRLRIGQTEGYIGRVVISRDDNGELGIDMTNPVDISAEDRSNLIGALFQALTTYAEAWGIDLEEEEAA